MTTQEMNKYAYELMIKNNPDEAAKQLLLKDKLTFTNDRLIKMIRSISEDLAAANKIKFKLTEYITRQLEATKDCIEFNREQHNFSEVEKYTRDYNLYINIIKIIGE